MHRIASIRLLVVCGLIALLVAVPVARAARSVEHPHHTSTTTVKPAGAPGKHAPHAPAAPPPKPVEPTLAQLGAGHGSGDNAGVIPFARRATFSPDGDGAGDRLSLSVCAPLRTRMALRVYSWSRPGGWLVVWVNQSQHAGNVATRRWCGDRASLVRMRWNGMLADGSPAPDGPYIVTACVVFRGSGSNVAVVPPLPPTATHWRASGSADDDAVEPMSASRINARVSSRLPRGKGSGCLPSPVQAHLRRLTAATDVARSFLPGDNVPLTTDSDETSLTVQLLDADGEVAIGDPQQVPVGVSQFSLPPTLAPGLYRLQVKDAVGATRLVPIVVRSTTPVDEPAPGTALVVWPYLTWRAYNRFDANRDGSPDTWYLNWAKSIVSLTGPYENGTNVAVPSGAEADQPHLLGFMNWLAGSGRPVQMITDYELGRMSLDQLARYPAIVFPGHTEYYEPATYDLMSRYRDAGGHLLFLSANNFFRTVQVDDRSSTVRMTDVAARYPTQSDFALVGVGFSCCVANRVTVPFSAQSQAMHDLPWIFAGTGLHAGELFGRSGYEVDEPDPTLSPPSLTRLAIALPGGGDVPPRATMSYYRQGNGWVFASGNMAFVRWLSGLETEQRISSRLLSNVWKRAVEPAPSPDDAVGP